MEDLFKKLESNDMPFEFDEAIMYQAILHSVIKNQMMTVHLVENLLLRGKSEKEKDEYFKFIEEQSVTELTNVFASIVAISKGKSNEQITKSTPPDSPQQ